MIKMFIFHSDWCFSVSTSFLVAANVRQTLAGYLRGDGVHVAILGQDLTQVKANTLEYLRIADIINSALFSVLLVI